MFSTVDSDLASITDIIAIQQARSQTREARMKVSSQVMCNTEAEEAEYSLTPILDRTIFAVVQ